MMEKERLGIWLFHSVLLVTVFWEYMWFRLKKEITIDAACMVVWVVYNLRGGGMTPFR